MSTPVKEQYIIAREGNKTAIILSIRQGRGSANEQYEQMLEPTFRTSTFTTCIGHEDSTV